MYTRILALALMASTATAQQHLGENTDLLTFRKAPRTQDDTTTNKSLSFETELAKRIVNHARKECADKKPEKPSSFNIRPYRSCVMKSVNLTRTRLKNLLESKRVFSGRYPATPSTTQ